MYNRVKLRGRGGRVYGEGSRFHALRPLMRLLELFPSTTLWYAAEKFYLRVCTCPVGDLCARSAHTASSPLSTLHWTGLRGTWSRSAVTPSWRLATGREEISLLLFRFIPPLDEGLRSVFHNGDVPSLESLSKRFLILPLSKMLSLCKNKSRSCTHHTKPVYS